MRMAMLLGMVMWCFNGFAQKDYTPTKVVVSPKLDGKPDDAVWQNVPVINDFVKSFPDFGKPASEKTAVKIIYDNTAIYVLATMYCDPKNIRRQLTQRDVIDFQDVDNFSIGFDTYQDRQNAFLFTVTAAGVQGDVRLSNNDADRSWDAVWMSAVSFQTYGWVAEIKIPLSAIRFAKKDSQNWGLQLKRFLRKNNENVTWSPEDPNKDGTMNQWGNLNQLQNIIPPLRLSFLPYISGGVRNSPTFNGRKVENLASGGMDVKWGINESFTVDMTLIPDFAQVQSDNLILNLTPFEVRFDDFRPFFTEGTELFNKAGLFYSRRIGAEPSGVSDVLNFVNNNNQYEIIKNPGITRLINATKLSGRTKKNVGIGVFNAITAPMNAKLNNKNSGKDTIIATEPLANYNVLVIDKALKNRSSLTFTNTNVMRKGNSRNANVSAIDVNLFDKKNNYNFSNTFRYSTIWGTNGNYNGFTAGSRFGKVSGKWQYSLGTSVESDEYDPNDVGFLLNNNSFEQYANVSLNYNYPTKKFLIHRYNFNINNTYTYKPMLWQDVEVEGNAFFLFKNFWDMSVLLSTKPLQFYDYFESRTPGVNMKRFSYAFLAISGSTDSRKKLYASWFFGGAESEAVKGDPYYNVQMTFRYRFSPKLQISADMRRIYDKGQWGFSHRDGISTIVPGFNDPIIAFRNVKTNNLIVSGQYSFTPRMNWTVRMRHNWTYVDNRSFHKLNKNGSWNDLPFLDNRNRNFNVFNVDMFYTWDFKWGSRLTFAWKNALGSTVSLNPYEFNRFDKNLGAMFTNPHSNELTLKIVYFLDYLDVKKKRNEN